MPNIPGRCLSQHAERVLELSRASGDLAFLVDRRHSDDLPAISAMFRERYDYLAS